MAFIGERFYEIIFYEDIKNIKRRSMFVGLILFNTV